MPPAFFTQAQDKALIAQIIALPAQRIAAALLFLTIRKMHDRVAIVQYIAGL